MPGEAAAFMCYARFNDAHDDGQLNLFRELLTAEVRVQTGAQFAIFQDRADIALGQDWQRRIDEALDMVTLLVAVITPGFFKSTACRAEMTRFLEREQALGRSEQILPIYYITAREMEDPAARESDELAQVLARRQFADWRELRFEPSTSPVARKAVTQLAVRMREMVFTSGNLGLPRTPDHNAQVSGSPRLQAERDPSSRPSLRTEPPTHVVDAGERGDFSAISAAIRAARPGDRIVVRPGRYEEALVVDKPLEILGDGPAEEIEVVASGATTLEFQATIGRVANLTLRQAGGEGQWYGVDITSGRLDLEGCEIRSDSLACVVIRGGADPRLRRNYIRGRSSGVLVHDYGLGTLEDNQIVGNHLSGVEIRGGGNPYLRRNRISDNEGSGVLIHRSGEGTVEDNEIVDNGNGVAISDGGNPVVRHNRIAGSKRSGIFVYDAGQGYIEDNDITVNTLSGVEVGDGGDPVVRDNRINGNGYRGVWLHNDCRGTFEGNDLTGNSGGAWLVDAGAEQSAKRDGNRE
jgi:parallel beta-helix repeat protein